MSRRDEVIKALYQYLPHALIAKNDGNFTEITERYADGIMQIFPEALLIPHEEAAKIADGIDDVVKRVDEDGPKLRDIIANAGSHD